MADSSAGGISALGLNLKSFIFQLITFVIVFAILKKYVFSKIGQTLESRRTVLEASLEHARETEEKLHAAEVKVEELLHHARVQADQALADAKVQGEKLIAAAEESASAKADLLIAAAEESLGHEREKLKTELKGELAGLVALATEKVTRAKLDQKAYRDLIVDSLKGLKL